MDGLLTGLLVCDACDRHYETRQCCEQHPVVYVGTNPRCPCSDTALGADSLDRDIYQTARLLMTHPSADTIAAFRIAKPDHADFDDAEIARLIRATFLSREELVDESYKHKFVRRAVHRVVAKNMSIGMGVSGVGISPEYRFDEEEHRNRAKADFKAAASAFTSP